MNRPGRAIALPPSSVGASSTSRTRNSVVTGTSAHSRGRQAAGNTDPLHRPPLQVSAPFSVGVSIWRPFSGQSPPSEPKVVRLVTSTARLPAYGAPFLVTPVSFTFPPGVSDGLPVLGQVGAGSRAPISWATPLRNANAGWHGTAPGHCA